MKDASRLGWAEPVIWEAIMQDEYVNGDAMIREEIEKLERSVERIRTKQFVTGNIQDGYPPDPAKEIASLEAQIANLRSQLSGA